MNTEWKPFKLEEMIRFRNGKSIKPGADGKYPAYGSNGVIGASDSFMYHDAIILGRVGAYCGSVQRCFGRFWASDNTIVVEPNIEVADVQFTYYLLLDARLNQHAGGAAQPLITQSRLKPLEFVIPPLETQRRITSILSAYDNLIENNMRRIAILEEMARRLYMEWFVHFRFPGHEETEFDEELPKGWKEVPLGDLVDVKWGDTKTTKKSYVENGYLAYSAAGPDGFLPHHDYDRTGIVLSAIGANCGVTWLARGKWSCIKNTIRLFANSTSISDEYLYFVTGFSDYWPKRGAAQPFISQGDAKICKIVVPPNDLHNMFLSFASPALKHSDKLRITNINLRAQRDLLLPKLVSGEIDVSEAEAGLEAAE